MLLLHTRLDDEAARLDGASSRLPSEQPSSFPRDEKLRVAESSAEAPQSFADDQEGRCGGDMFPWSKEFALWYGPASLVVAPSSRDSRGASCFSMFGIFIVYYISWFWRCSALYCGNRS